jgi:hypothetical protein
VLKMSIAGENVRDGQILHDNHRCEVDEDDHGSRSLPSIKP